MAGHSYDDDAARGTIIMLVTFSAHINIEQSERHTLTFQIDLVLHHAGEWATQDQRQSNSENEL